jgi:pSer/pThr/pTyr-binding forkhead associated (FHA) protein
MKHPPNIVVQLVHIQGPLKGEIQEFSESPISIGRHPSCHLRFPADLTIMSRKHADIVREGNRFKVVDRSKNGTLVNGKKVAELYLKDGDVLTFAEGGPKVSFLTQIREEAAEPVSPSPPVQAQPEFTPEPEPQVLEKQEITSPPPEPERAVEVVVQKVQTPVIIQYGPTLRSFKEAPVTIGKNLKCDFVLDHPSVLDRHAQIFFCQDQYWVKDLTGKSLVAVNRQPINLQVSLESGDELSLNPEGPVFRFLGGGRLAEVEESTQKGPSNAGTPTDADETPHEAAPEGKAPERPLSKFKKFFRH